MIVNGAIIIQLVISSTPNFDTSLSLYLAFKNESKTSVAYANPISTIKRQIYLIITVKSC